MISYQDASGNVETIHTTDEHPFYVANRGWVSAGGTTVVVANLVQLLETPIVVYNIEVASGHTYFVEDGTGLQTPVWVHNKCTAEQLAKNAKIGRAGEEAANIVKNTKRITSLSGRAAYRIPDAMTWRTLTKVKNVAYQHFSTQLRDSLHYAIMTGRQMILKTRGTTKLSKELSAVIDAGWIKWLKEL